MALSKIDSDGIVSGGITADSLNIGQIGGRRNLIINGDMAISQRNTSFTNPLNQYTLDRWISQLDTTSARSTVTQESSGGPSGFRNFLRVTVTTADATLDSSDLQNIKQIIEGYNMRHTDQGTSDAETLTCSFWVRSSVTGTYSATLYLNSTGTQYAYPAEYTINSANTWEYKTVTFSPQTTSASWVSSGYTNGEYAQLRFGLMIGSGQGGTADTWNASNKFGASGQTNLFATNGATWDLTGVQLEVGSVASTYEHRSYGEELLACYRYYYKLFPELQDSYCSGSIYAYSTSNAVGNGMFPVKMRVAPTAIDLSAATDWNLNKVGGYNRNVTGLTWGNTTNTQFYNLNYACSSNDLTSAAIHYLKSANANAYIAWSAEL